MNSNVLRGLETAREMLSSPYKWTQGAARRDKYGDPIWQGSPIPVCRRCLSAAITDAALQVTDDGRSAAYMGAVNGMHDALAATGFAGPPGLKARLRQSMATPVHCTVEANDWRNTTHYHVLRWLDKAIERARGAK